MKNLRIALLLLAVPIVCTTVRGQSSDSAPVRPSPRVMQAHCRYAPNDPACTKRRQPPTPSSGAGQCRYPAPCPSACCPYGYPSPSRRPWLFEAANGTHAAAGALIGLGLGAALGASKDGNADSRLAGALIIGGLGALIGATVGHDIPARHWRRHRPDWDDPEENAQTRPGSAKRTAAASQTAAADLPSGP